MLPTFPNCKKISLEDKKNVEEYLRKFPPYSDFNFLSMWSYNTQNDVEIATLHNNLVVRLRDYITQEPFYSFLGNNNVSESIEVLLAHSEKEHLMPKLKLVPEESIRKDLGKLDKYNITQDRDHFDYILSVAELSELKGSRFHTQRNHVNRFNREHPQCNITILDMRNTTIQRQIIELFNLWAKRKNNDKENTHELEAIQRLLKDSSHFEILSIGIYDHEQLIGFIIGDMSQHKYAQSHFAKADTSYFGIFYMLYHHFAKQLQVTGYQFINNEQDLGIPNLRYSKEQWNPVRFLKKYTISHKEKAK